MSYESMSEEDKILQAFDFVALGVPIPNVIADFLKAEGLYDAITQPVEIINVATHREHAGHNGGFSGSSGEDLSASGGCMEAG